MGEAMTDNQNVMDFDDLKPQEMLVKYKGKRYILREASADAARQYRNATSRGASMSTSDRRISVPDSLGDAETILVSQCLFQIEWDNSNPTKERPMTLLQVRSWEARVIKPMFDWVMRVSDLSERDRVDPLTSNEKLEEQLLAKKDEQLGNLLGNGTHISG